ncbi:PLP-dependent transferase, partial [Bradyrhizobium sp. cir1]|uniref:PLP-dependent transferase n=1 Tax=Bradyrhizobium sp. cir1 TaxID=1445730 RepID=UPI001606B08B
WHLPSFHLHRSAHPRLYRAQAEAWRGVGLMPVTIAAGCRRSGVLPGCDNTWATGLLRRPLSLSVDIAAEAFTKYAGGRSDLLLYAIILDDVEPHARFRRRYHCRWIQRVWPRSLFDPASAKSSAHNGSGAGA